MEGPDLNFLQIQGYSLSLQQWIPSRRERAVRFYDEGMPIWSNLQNIADCVLFDHDVLDFDTPAEFSIDSAGHWIPYIFHDEKFGNCVVRAWF